MLNETWRLWQALDKAKIAVEPQHPLIKPLPRTAKHLLRIALSEDGGVVSVEGIARSEREGLWRIVQTSDGSFPVIAVNEPVLYLPRVPKDDKLREALEQNAYLLKGKSDWPWADARRKAAALRREAENIPELRELITRFSRASRNVGSFCAAVAERGIAQIEQGTLGDKRDESGVRELLLGKGWENGKCKPISVLLVLDVDQACHGRMVTGAWIEAIPF